MKYNPKHNQEHLLEGIETAIETVIFGVQKVNAETREGDVTAYRIGDTIRIELKNIDEEAIRS